MPLGGDGARRHRQLAIQVERIGNPPDVPELQEDAPAGGVHRLGHVAPATDLVIGPDAGGVGIAYAHRRDRGGLAEDQAGIGALGVVLGHQGVGHAAFIGAAAGQRRHDDAVGQLEVAEHDGIEQSSHGTSSTRE